MEEFSNEQPEKRPEKRTPEQIASLLIESQNLNKLGRGQIYKEINEGWSVWNEEQKDKIFDAFKISLRDLFEPWLQEINKKRPELNKIWDETFSRHITQLESDPVSKKQLEICIVAQEKLDVVNNEYVSLVERFDVLKGNSNIGELMTVGNDLTAKVEEMKNAINTFSHEMQTLLIVDLQACERYNDSVKNHNKKESHTESRKVNEPEKQPDQSIKKEAYPKKRTENKTETHQRTEKMETSERSTPERDSKEVIYDEMKERARDSAFLVRRFIETLRGTGVYDGRKFIQDKEIQEIIFETAAGKLKEGVWYYDCYVKDWQKEFDLDLETIGNSPEVKKALINKANEEARNGPGFFKIFTERALEAGLIDDVHVLDKEPTIIKTISREAKRLSFSGSSRDLSARYVNEWKKIGIELDSNFISQQ